MKKNFQKIIGIDAFRGLAAVLVFLFHYWSFYKEDLPQWTKIFSIGHIGVDLFFVLSGFLIMLSLYRSENFISYFKKRIARIAPLAMGSSLIFWVITTRLQNFSFESISDLFAHLFFINGFFPQWYHTINPVTWSISIEMAFYLLLPFIWIFFAKKNIKKFFIIFSSLVFLSFLYRSGLFFIFEDWSAEKRIIFSEQLWGRLDQFFLGIFLAFITLKYQTSIMKTDEKKKSENFLFFKKYQQIFLFSLSFLFLSISSFTFYFLQSDFREIFFAQIFLHFITAGGFFFLLWWFLFVSDEKKNNFFMRIFSFLGSISYGIYIFHFPILSQVSKSIHSPFLGFFIGIFLTIIFSYFSFHFFEKWFLKKRKK